MSIIQGNAHTSAGGGYQIERSLRFNSADSAYLNRTPGSAGNRKTWTWSGWVKRGDTANNSGSGASTELTIFGSGTNVNAGNGVCSLGITGGVNFQVWQYLAGTVWNVVTTQVFRDYSAWYHILIAVDTTQATSSNRVKMYVNGVQVTAFGTASYPSQNYDTGINSTDAHNIGRRPDGQNYWGGYLTENYLIDGQALTPSSFGETDSATGVWKPKAFSGTYGTNGFYLKFADNSGTTSTTLGKDSSGNGNNWTPNNFSVTAGAGNDSLVDSPTSYGTDTGVGGTVRGNYCTLNPLQNNGTLSNGNLDFADAGSDGWNNSKGTIGVSSGKFYWEMTANNVVSSVLCASVGGAKEALSQLPGQNDSFGVTYYADGRLYYNGTSTSGWGSSYTNGDVIGIALDMDNGKVWFSKNGTWQASGDPATGANAARSDLKTNDDTWFPMSGTFYAATTCTFNFGQRAFAYTAPSGFKALCTQNLPTPTIGATSTTQANDYFDVNIYTGNGSSQSITNSGSMKPDLVWVKSRSSATYHGIYDAVRGVSKRLWANDTAAEADFSPYGVTAFNSNGFTANDLTSGGYGVNENAVSYVGWQWRASNTTAVTNTAGTITSTVSANTTSGFSIVTYTGTGANATVGHGLGVAPKMVIVKGRSFASNWNAYHSNLTSASYYIRLNTTAAQENAQNFWNSTAPTSTVFSLSSEVDVNSSGNTFVAYCFAPVAGYSAFGSYTGNFNADGPFVFTGMRPRYIMIKRTDAAAVWFLFDTARNPSNNSANYLTAESSNAEGADAVFDILSNGFKLRVAANSYNANGGTYIYMAFAESPFKYSLAR